jgi:HSP20 family molecular chaperone IbpA
MLVKTDKIDATFDKGILTIKLPKSEEAKKNEIKIKVH